MQAEIAALSSELDSGSDSGIDETFRKFPTYSKEQEDAAINLVLLKVTKNFMHNAVDN